jgi:CHC2 zinc finger/Toprim domain
MIDDDLIHAARQTPIERVAGLHGLKLKRVGAERVGPCPRCGGRDRFSINVRKQLFHCRGCGAGGGVIALEQFLSGLDFREAVERLTGRSARRQMIQAAPIVALDTGRADSAAALALWEGSADPRGTIVETYLNSRALKLDADLAPDAIRWNARIGAMIALFRHIASDEPRAVSRTFIDASGRKIERKFLGPVGGCAVKLDRDADVLDALHIGEGIESCVAARQIGHRPAWALGSAGAIATFPVLSGVQSLFLLREHDDVNARAALACGLLWHDAGRRVFNVWPEIGKDINDEIMGASA